MSSLFIAETLVFAAAVYTACGIAFALVFLVFGVQRVDTGAASAGWPVRLIWLPGTAALWPLLAARWIRGGESPVERNAHRDLATKGAAA